MADWIYVVLLPRPGALSILMSRLILIVCADVSYSLLSHPGLYICYPFVQSTSKPLILVLRSTDTRNGTVDLHM